ncbi:Superfamily II DNA or RNA helicase [Flexibacter flexilis DSM 6793]|uniref:Superfamily II DNA or RNA helicase n=1 Tax=Flexibacter flexilis DSM 6793 TaxID=927664 RepID=A0A1I1N6V5_9BACT|nr:DEAD/DEAH box helicase family protein [Flexibacter flexilis]SFC93434.1 Superfamily II DNA or RNA helicase [Flexibacter flexilis DSM 6793]
MLKDCEWSIDRDYKTGSENEPMQFYLEGLANSSEFHLLLGYFSSAAINLLSIGFATFISKGGKMRMVINHLLSEKDKAVVEKGLNENPNKVFDLTDIVTLGRILDEYDTHFFECLAYLIAEKRIEIKVVKPKNGRGIAHYKSGVFTDGENSIAYKASCNFTLRGLSENLEELEAFLSWENGRSNKLIKKQMRIIDNYFAENDDSVEYLSASDIEIAIRDRFGNKDLDELIVQESQLLKKKVSLINNGRLKQTILKLHKEIDKVIHNPRFPNNGTPRTYQVEAYQNWVTNDYKGIFAMATGTGKTITSLNCLLEDYKKENSYKAIILVPTTALLEQWKKECAKFNFKNVITVSSKEKWEDKLAFFNTASKLIDTSYIVIVTYASLSRDKFQSFFKQLPKETLLIADETHNLGSQGLLKILPTIHLEKRIGLSATPHRKFDEAGNTAIEEFFNDKSPYIVSYSMKQALENGFLCQYTYFPHIVKLTEEEMKRYKEISLQLLRMGLFDEKGNFKSSPEIEKKLLERKRIIHKATNKIDAFQKILNDEFKQRKNLKYTLVYVPEGVEANFEYNDFIEETEDENKLINEYTRVVSNTDDSVMVKQFTSNSTNREGVLINYEKGITHVLTSMKCLDEGVDVPRSELAIFCASTGNPRQFIQRRGRVLRLHKDKIHATIHDLVVIPEVSNNESTFEMEKSLVRKELERVVDFANLAMNKTETYNSLKDVLDQYNLNLNDI